MNMSTPNNQAASSPQDDECDICTEGFSDQHPPVPLDNCRHIFCKRCIESWMASENSNKDKCPECRTLIGAQFDDAQENLDYPAYSSRGWRLIVQPKVQLGLVQHIYFNGDGFVGQVYKDEFDDVVETARAPSHQHYQVHPSTSGRHYADYDGFYNYDSSDEDSIRTAFAHFNALCQNIENSYFVAPAPERRGLRNRLRDVFSGRSSRGAAMVYSVASNGMARTYVRRRPRGTRDTRFELVYERR
jgi:hypothetical protein